MTKPKTEQAAAETTSTSTEGVQQGAKRPKFMALDTETSGKFDFKKPADDPNQPRLASVAMIFLDEDLQIVTESHCLIKPDGWELTEEAARVNGLTMEQLERDGIPIKEALQIYTDAIEEGYAVAAHNAQFDCKMMRGELRRADMDDLFEKTANLCTMRKLTNVCQIPPASGRGAYKFPKLSEACVFFGLSEVGDHTSLNDARAVVHLLREMRKRNVDMEPTVHYARPDNPAKVAREKASPAAQAPKEAVPY